MLASIGTYYTKIVDICTVLETTSRKQGIPNNLSERTIIHQGV